MAPYLTLIGLLLGSLLAYSWPRLAGSGFDPFVAASHALWPLIALAMTSIGWLLPRDEIQQIRRRWPAVLGGTALQYTAMPTLAYLSARAAGLERDVMLGTILVGCVPGAMASNVLAMLARGNVSYSVSLTTVATLVSPLVVPLALYWTLGRQDVSFPAVATVRDLLGYVVIPVLLGYALGRRFACWERWARPIGQTVANVVILWIIAVVVAVNRSRLATPDLTLVAVLLGVNLGGYLAGYLGGRIAGLPTPMRRALTLEIGMQNAGLGTTLALGLFPREPAVAIPGAIYTFGCMLTGTILATFWARRPAMDETPRIASSPLEPCESGGFPLEQ